MLDAPLISVIVPIYNAEPYLRQALKSIQEQSFPDFEVLCINDGSTDDSLLTVLEFTRLDRRFIVLDKPNGGYGSACNEGMRHARGQWISIIEPDDWIFPDMYQKMIDFAETYASSLHPIDIVKTPYWRIFEDDEGFIRRRPCNYQGIFNPRFQPFVLSDDPWLLREHPSIWSALYRRDFLIENDIRFNEYPGAGWADNPFFVETLGRAKGIVYLPEAFYCYREDTEEKLRLFAQNNTLMPLVRWNEMTDLLDSMGITDKNVRAAHNLRGFAYVNTLSEYMDISVPEIDCEVRRVFERMNPDTVFTDPYLSPGYKRLFAEYRGLQMPKGMQSDYLKYLASRTVEHAKEAGIADTAKTVVHKIFSR